MNTENPYNIDMKSTEPQAMSEKRAGTAILAETLKDYFGALNFFAAPIRKISLMRTSLRI